jgi:hypothetical protein
MVRWLSRNVAVRVRRGRRLISAVAAAIGVWTIVASLVFSLHTVTWLGFASAVALAGVAAIGLTAHELSTERVGHSIEVEHGSTTPRDPVAA